MPRSFQTTADPIALIGHLNAVWRNCRDRGVSPAATLAEYRALGLTQNDASAILSVQLARYEENPSHPEAGELGVSSWLPFNG